jgi:hypothetical protein
LLFDKPIDFYQDGMAIPVINKGGSHQSRADKGMAENTG